MPEALQQVDQDEIAQRMGVPSSVVSKWLTGKRLPRTRNLRALAREIGQQPEQLEAELRTLRGPVSTRESKPDSQTAIGKRIWVSQVTISRWLTGVSIPQPRNLERLATALGEDPIDLLGELYALKLQRKSEQSSDEKKSSDFT